MENSEGVEVLKTIIEKCNGGPAPNKVTYIGEWVQYVIPIDDNHTAVLSVCKDDLSLIEKG